MDKYLLKCCWYWNKIKLSGNEISNALYLSIQEHSLRTVTFSGMVKDPARSTYKSQPRYLRTWPERIAPYGTRNTDRGEETNKRWLYGPDSKIWISCWVRLSDCDQNCPTITSCITTYLFIYIFVSTVGSQRRDRKRHIHIIANAYIRTGIKKKYTYQRGTNENSTKIQCNCFNKIAWILYVHSILR